MIKGSEGRRFTGLKHISWRVGRSFADVIHAAGIIIDNGAFTRHAL